MRCVHPIDVRVPISFHGFQTGLKKVVQVPCGKCIACRRRRQNEWSFRIQVEAESTIRQGGSVWFTTLTIDDEHLEYCVDDLSGYMEPTLKSKKVGEFVRRLRQYAGLSVRYFACGEYGDHITENWRPHYHIVLFFQKNIDYDTAKEVLNKYWYDGLVLKVLDLSPKLAEYVAKYSVKQIGEDYGNRVKPFAKMSLKPAIGYDYLKYGRYHREHNLFVAYDLSGTRVNLPRFYYNKMFPKEMAVLHSRALQRQQFMLDEFLLRRNPLAKYYDYQNRCRFEEALVKKLNFHDYD